MRRPDRHHLGGDNKALFPPPSIRHPSSITFPALSKPRQQYKTHLVRIDTMFIVPCDWTILDTVS